MITANWTNGHMEYEAGYFRDKTLRTENSVFVDTKFSVEVEAIIGFPGRQAVPPQFPYVVFGETSGWSNAQTITIPETSSTPSSSPNPTPTPTVPEFPVLAIVALFSVMTLTSALMLKKRSRL